MDRMYERDTNGVSVAEVPRSAKSGGSFDFFMKKLYIKDCTIF